MLWTIMLRFHLPTLKAQSPKVRRLVRVQVKDRERQGLNYFDEKYLSIFKERNPPKFFHFDSQSSEIYFTVHAIFKD